MAISRAAEARTCLQGSREEIGHEEGADLRRAWGDGDRRTNGLSASPVAAQHARLQAIRLCSCIVRPCPIVLRISCPRLVKYLTRRPDREEYPIVDDIAHVYAINAAMATHPRVAAELGGFAGYVPPVPPKPAPLTYHGTLCNANNTPHNEFPVPFAYTSHYRLHHRLYSPELWVELECMICGGCGHRPMDTLFTRLATGTQQART